jgi:cardiolipin synthase
LSHPSISALYLASEWMIRIAMLLYVPQRRTPSAARAWLLLIFFLPLPGLLLYGLMGRIYVPRRRIALQRRASQLIRAVQAKLPPAQEGDFSPQLAAAADLATQLGDFKPVAGNQVVLLAGYERPLAALIEDINAATSSILMLFYIFDNDETGQRVAHALLAAAARGVECRILMDAAGSRRGLRRLAPTLRAAGIEVRGVLPVGLFRRNVARFDLRNHRKIVVIDDAIAYTGSQNIVNAEFIPGCPNEELVVRVTGAVVLQFKAVILADWFFETTELPSEQLQLHAPDSVTGTTIAQVLPSGPGYGRENTKELMIALIYAARKEVIIATPYFVPDEPFLQAIVAASRRGVRVQLLLTKRSNQAVTHLAQQSYYSQLMQAGVEIALYEGCFLHAKHMAVDQRLVLIGSTNMDIRSFALNAEVSLLCYDEEVMRQLHAVHADYLKRSSVLDHVLWSQRPMRRRLLQNLARLADSLL